MIAWLKGEVLQCEEECVTLNVQGVGYQVLCTAATIDELRTRPTTELFIHTHVREDAFQLFGFLTAEERTLFLSLIKVNGIGPRSALHILGAATFGRIVDLIEAGDAKGLSGLPKIGKKTAEQIVLTLKGQLVFARSSPVLSPRTNHEQIISALVNLGFKLVDVERVVQSLDPKAEIEQGVRESLSRLTTL